ncbi:MAG TPA: type IV pili twitching motility protein PilT [Elusimicrobia bacterium]|nr:MAG: hypothetical protein A2278_09315 [Elusimicrobia bacterium RIFOXYA12_FULL_49_49]OGS06889.1 MAG: hypothetical protein A2204_04205 [Elusimicrobia bacterium RIFOXYA1_FULL_47_7]OGS14982.1 MAG: hypothetical protein A2251_08170 [Elusimicrobia bacterium RIFOXYA2_FULL_47_53]OGS26083.1 MAG: hypothetical protein A2339_02105 [Elusimicrobia bacterium RIFOXYB12_FULL_50_12]OGS29326.1 MAG: hypothetical protein A2323_04100 [Elusimicrobia bacterium RIFOXYB2_FULL_46_23]HBU70321.1 type IV pili twitching m
MEINAILKEMVDKKASDMHIRANGHAMLRIDGQLVEAQGAILSAGDTASVADSVMNSEQKKVFKERREVDLSYTFEGVGRFRINIFSQRGFVNMALRIIPTQIPSISDLKLPSVISKIADNQRGLVLVTGTTGCGKSTTLAAMINHINSNRSAHIVTIEDPIEFMHGDKKSIVSQRELGFDTLSYADAMKHVVRQDPDVILLGEMRDLETMATAISAAQTGHLVLSTIHTVDAAQSIHRIIDLFPTHQQNQIRLMLADTLKAVISQRLLPAAKGPGRVPAVEVLIVTALAKKMIEENNTGEITNLMKQGQYYGMQTFNQALLALYKEGAIELEDALYAATNPEELMLTIRGVQSGSDNASSYFTK